MQLQDRQVGIAGADEATAASDRRHDRCGFSGNERLDAAAGRVVDVIPRVVTQQILNHKQADGGQTGGELRSDAMHGREGAG